MASSDIEKQNIFSIVAKRSVFGEIEGKADHFMRYGSTQWSLPTPETYQELIDKFGIDNWTGFREYESLRQEYESLRFVHNVDIDHNNVFIMNRDKGNYHSCQKPLDILERIINCSSNPGHTILDPFMGSGSTCVAAINTGREYIGFEREDKYFEIAEQRIKEAEEKRNS
jgi:site-specific DNA-methyltransferase (adenine-specific)